jgi:hypothetical protein
MAVVFEKARYCISLPPIFEPGMHRQEEKMTRPVSRLTTPRTNIILGATE